MKELYSAEMLASLNGKLKKRWILVGIISALLLAGFVWSVAIRVEWLSIALLALLGVFLIFFIEMFCRPLLDYRKDPCWITGNWWSPPFPGAAMTG